MCTVSWRHSNDGYELLCNRDERHTRNPAMSPFIQERCGVRFIAPLDGDHYGSWIAVNQFGLTFCLLNRYGWGPDIPVLQATSRGLLLMEMVDCSSVAEARHRITGLELERFRPFDLALLEPQRPCSLVHWTGRDCRVEQDGEYAKPLVSSSFDQTGVATHRRRLFSELLEQRNEINSALLHEFHASHLPLPSAYSPCMHREEASTVSFSRVQVAGDRIEFSYLPHPPCGLRSPVAGTMSMTNHGHLKFRCGLPIWRLRHFT